ncbi:MAG: PAS domain S-box protein, partial [Anaerolineae bacterium]|nr:PAS domain S-box protein [Anaerolineae bacterium]
YRTLLEQSPDAIYLLQGNRLLDANPRFEELLGIDRAVLNQANFNIMAFVAPRSKALIEQRAQLAEAGRANELPSHYEFTARRSDGHEFDVEASVAYFTIDGQVATQGLLRDLTAHRQAEQALYESEGRFRSAFENTPIGMALLDTEGTCRQVNQALCYIVGYMEDELLTMRIHDLTVAEDRHNLYDTDSWRRILSGEITAYQVEKRYRRKDGHLVWVLASTTTVHDTRGKPRYLILQVQDISARKQAEQEREQLLAALQQRNTQLHTAAEVSKAASTLLDPHALIQETVALVRERFGFYYVGLFLLDDAEQYAVLQAGTGAAGQQMVAEGFRLPVGGTSMIGQCVAQGQARIALEAGQEAARFDNPLLPNTRSEIVLPLLTRGHCIGAITIQSDRPAAFSDEDIATLHTMMDQLAATIENARLYDAAKTEIARRMEAEREIRLLNENLERRVEERTRQLHQTMHQLRVIIDYSADPVALTLPNGDVIMTNPAFRALFAQGAPNIEAILDILAEPLHVERMTRALVMVLQQYDMARVEVAIVRPDGSQFDADVALVPVTDETAPTDQVNDRREIIGVVLTLHDITRLKELDRFKSQFVANAAHDLANPIANLKLHLYAIRQAPARLERHLEALESQTRRLETLVNDLRMLSNMDRGLIGYVIESFDFTELVADVVEAHRPLADSHALVLEFVPCPAPILVSADLDKMERVVANLLTNAINYTPEGGTITIGTHCTADEVTLVVSDTGIGIAPDEVMYIFERFYRTHRARSSTIAGTGLGLSIVKEIVESHGGHIDVQSTPDTGSVFTVRLPLTSRPTN